MTTASAQQISHSPLLLSDPPGRIELSGRGQAAAIRDRSVNLRQRAP